MLEVRDLNIILRSQEIVKNISLRVEQGELIALVGGNAAGKTSLLRAIIGLLSQHSGEIYFGGREISELQAYQRVNMGLSFCSAERQIFPLMSVEENLKIGGHRFGRSGRSEVSRSMLGVYNLFPVLDERRKLRAGVLSGGEQKMLAIGRALMMRPKLMLMDEPFLGLSPEAISLLAGAIAQINQQGPPILYTEQNHQLAASIAQRTIIIERGEIKEADKNESEIEA